MAHLMMLQAWCPHWSTQPVIIGLVLPELPEPEAGQVIHQIVHDGDCGLWQGCCVR